MIRRRILSAVAIGMLGFALAAPQRASGAAPGRTTASLNRTLPEMKFDGVALVDAIDFVRDITNANITVNWKALEAAGVTRDTVINLKLRNVSLRKALTLMLAEASGGEGVTYTIDSGVIEITTTDLANQQTYTRVYPVGDLLMDIPNFTDAPDFSLQSQSQSGGRGGGGGGQSLFGGAGNGGGQAGESTGSTRQERADELLNLIRETIYPDIWRENGGTASIRMYRDSLVVTAPRHVHEAIGGTWD
jgi:hypothetical protein